MLRNHKIFKTNHARIEKGDTIYLIDPESPGWIAVNAPGEEVLAEIDGHHDLEGLHQKFRGKYSKKALDDFLNNALRAGFIDTKPIRHDKYLGRSHYLKPGKLSEIWVYVTNRCNLRCEHCLVSAGEETRPETPSEKIKKAIEEAKGLGVNRVFFTGGEPFLRRDIFDLIGFVTKELKLELVILTNGTLLDESKVDKLSRIEGIVIQVSLESSEASFNDSIRGKGAHEKALKAIGMLRKKGVRTIVTSTAMKKNIKEIPKLSERLHKGDVRTHHVLWVHKRGRASENPIIPDNKDLIKLMNTLKGKEIKVDNWESYRSKVFGNRGTKVDGCNAGYTFLSIDSNGDIYPCPSLYGHEAFRMGSIDEGLEKVWKESPRGKDFRELTVNDIEECSGCELRFFCGGGCRCQAYFGSDEKNLLARDPYCSVIKEMILESLQDFVQLNGIKEPTILGGMQSSSYCSDSCGDGDNAIVAPFHCTCVLDVSTHKSVSERYGCAADNPQGELCCPTGYSDTDLEGLPQDTISVSYGCGNPSAFADLGSGEAVLDIGSGGGIDCFIAAKKVGASGSVIGIDMTDEMLKKARKNNQKMAQILGYDVVEFRKGIAEELPVESGSVDLVISNCVINLSPDKEKVFKEVYRVLKIGGRISISDIVSDKEVPEDMKADPELWSGCISGTLQKEEFLGIIEKAGFKRIETTKSYLWKEIQGIEFHSLTLKAHKEK